MPTSDSVQLWKNGQKLMSELGIDELSTSALALEPEIGALLDDQDPQNLERLQPSTVGAQGRNTNSVDQVRLQVSLRDPSVTSPEGGC